MGYNEHRQPNSSGTLVAVIGVGMVLAVLSIVVVAAVGLYWVRGSRMQTQAVVMEQRALAMEQRAVAEMYRAEARARVEAEEASVVATRDPRLDFQLGLDREGNMTVDGTVIGLDELRTRLAKLKQETSNVFSVRVIADPECPIKLVIPVLDTGDEIGDIDVRIVSSKNFEKPADAHDGGLAK